MADKSWKQLRSERLAEMTPERRATYETAYAEAGIALELARVVYEARTRAGITQTELARRMKSHQSVVARIENAGTLPSITTLDRLARALGMHLRIGVGDGERAPEFLVAG